MWQPENTAPRTGEWIVVKYLDNHPFTVRWNNPFPADEALADFRDERGKARLFTKWMPCL